MSLFGSIVPQLGHRSGVRAVHDRAAIGTRVPLTG